MGFVRGGLILGLGVPYKGFKKTGEIKRKSKGLEWKNPGGMVRVVDGVFFFFLKVQIGKKRTDKNTCTFRV